MNKTLKNNNNHIPDEAIRAIAQNYADQVSNAFSQYKFVEEVISQRLASIKAIQDTLKGLTDSIAINAIKEIAESNRKIAENFKNIIDTSAISNIANAFSIQNSDFLKKIASWGQ